MRSRFRGRQRPRDDPRRARRRDPSPPRPIRLRPGHVRGAARARRLGRALAGLERRAGRRRAAGRGRARAPPRTGLGRVARPVRGRSRRDPPGAGRAGSARGRDGDALRWRRERRRRGARRPELSLLEARRDGRARRSARRRDPSRPDDELPNRRRDAHARGLARRPRATLVHADGLAAADRGWRAVPRGRSCVAVRPGPRRSRRRDPGVRDARASPRARRRASRGLERRQPRRAARPGRGRRASRLRETAHRRGGGEGGGHGRRAGPGGRQARPAGGASVPTRLRPGPDPGVQHELGDGRTRGPRPGLPPAVAARPQAGRRADGRPARAPLPPDLVGARDDVPRGSPLRAVRALLPDQGAAGRRARARRASRAPLASGAGSVIPRYFVIAERDHELQNPISVEKLVLLGERLRLGPGSRVLDIASGRGGPALVLARTFGCSVEGVEVEPEFHAAAIARAEAESLGDRLSFRLGDASDARFEPEGYDAALCLGATFVFGGLEGTVDALLPSVRPGGHVVVGEPYWRTWPLPVDYERGDEPYTSLE